MDIVSRLMDDLGRLLRYFLPALVGVAAAWLVPPGSEVLSQAVSQPSAANGISWVPLMLFVVVVGVVIYTIHSNVVYRLVIVFILGKILKEVTKPGSGSKEGSWQHRLSAARWDRRYCKGNKKKARVQQALSAMNHGGHFLYCSSYAILLVPCILDQAFHPTTARPWWVLVAVAGIVWLCAFVSDILTTRWDARAMVTFGGSVNSCVN